MTFAYYGHHKCASTWITEILYAMARRSGWRIGKHEPLKGRGADRASLFAANDIVVYPNAEPSDVHGAPGFHVVRDPRDILVSAYFSHRNTHPTRHWPALRHQRRKLRQLSEEEGIIDTLDFVPNVFESLAAWDYSNPQILELRMEDLTREPYGIWLRIARHVDILNDHAPTQVLAALHDAIHRILKRGIVRRSGITGQEVLAAVYAHRFERLSGGRRPGEVDEASHYRSGRPGTWQRHWTPRIDEAFHDRLGDLVQRLGYAERPLEVVA